MSFKSILTDDDRIQFRVIFEADDSLNSLAILQNDVVIATDANVDDETYHLPVGDYVASLTFWGPVGTIGTLKIQTNQGERKRAAKIREGAVRETISISFTLA